MELASVAEGGGRTRRGAEDEAAESGGHYPHISLKADRQVRPFNHLQQHLDHHPRQAALRLLTDATLKHLQKRPGGGGTPLTRHTYGFWGRAPHGTVGKSMQRLKLRPQPHANAAQRDRRRDVMAQMKTHEK